MPDYNTMPLQYPASRPQSGQDIKDQYNDKMYNDYGALVRAISILTGGASGGIFGSGTGALVGAIGGPVGALTGAGIGGGVGMLGGGMTGSEIYENSRNSARMRGQLPPMAEYGAQPPLADQMPPMPEYPPHVPPNREAIIRALSGK